MSVQSIPEYQERHSGVCIVLGSAWTAHDDLKKALGVYPGAFLVGVNRSVEHYRCDMMVAIDRNNAQSWKETHVEKFGPVKLHGGRQGACGGLEAYPWYDYFWPELQYGGGTSSMLAARIAMAVGFDKVILCGAPLSNGPYLDGEDDWSRRNQNALNSYRGPWRKAMHKGEIFGKVYSMSGWTRELLGDIYE